MGRGQGQGHATTPAPSRNALIHSSDHGLEEAQEILDRAGATEWTAFLIEGEDGVYVMPKYGVPVSDFTDVLFAFGDGWMMTKDPRHQSVPEEA